MKLIIIIIGFNDSFCTECTQLEDECVCNDGFERDRENERLCRGEHINRSSQENFYCFNNNYVADIDECAFSRDNCDENSLCHNTVGSFSCVCDDGFVGDGTACTGKNIRPLNFHKYNVQ